MLQRERPRKVRLGIELEADALLSISGAQAYLIALKRAGEASSAKWHATGVSSPRLWRASREPGHLCSMPCLDEHEEWFSSLNRSCMNCRVESQKIMIDGQIIVALAEAFLIGIVFGSGLEILAKEGR